MGCSALLRRRSTEAAAARSGARPVGARRGPRLRRRVRGPGLPHESSSTHDISRTDSLGASDEPPGQRADHDRPLLRSDPVQPPIPFVVVHRDGPASAATMPAPGDPAVACGMSRLRRHFGWRVRGSGRRSRPGRVRPWNGSDRPPRIADTAASCTSCRHPIATLKCVQSSGRPPAG